MLVKSHGQDWAQLGLHKNRKATSYLCIVLPQPEVSLQTCICRVEGDGRFIILRQQLWNAICHNA